MVFDIEFRVKPLAKVIEFHTLSRAFPQVTQKLFPNDHPDVVWGHLPTSTSTHQLPPVPLSPHQTALPLPLGAPPDFPTALAHAHQQHQDYIGFNE